MVRLKLIRPRPEISAPNRGKTGINQAESAAEGIQTNQVVASVGSSVQQLSEPGVKKCHSTDGDVAVRPPEHPHGDGDA